MPWLARFVAEAHAAQIECVAGRVEQLDPVRHAARAVGHRAAVPRHHFVQSRAAVGDDVIRRARTGAVRKTGDSRTAIGQTPLRHTFALWAVVDAVDLRPIRGVQRNRPAFSRQLEIEMAGARFFVGEQSCESARRDE